MHTARSRIPLILCFDNISNQTLFNDSFEKSKVHNIPSAMALSEFLDSRTSAYASGGAHKHIPLKLFCDISEQHLFNDSFEQSKIQNIPDAMTLLEFPGSLTSAYASGGARSRIPLILFYDISNQPLFNDSFEKSEVTNIPNAMALLEFPGSLISAYKSGGARRRIHLIWFFDISNQRLFNDIIEKWKVQNIPSAMALLQFPGTLTSAYASGCARRRVLLVLVFDISNQPLLNDSSEKSKVQKHANTNLCSAIALRRQQSRIDLFMAIFR